MGSIRTLHNGKKADALQKELEGILRHAKNEIVDLFEAHGFMATGDWIQVDDHREIVFDDSKVGSGGVRVFRRNSCGRFYVIRFREVEYPDRDAELFSKTEEIVAKVEKQFTQAELQNPILSNGIFMDLDWFLDNSVTWIERMMIPCPECGGTGETTLDGPCDCATCEGTGEIYRDSLP